MTTEREMLDYAAKSCGIEGVWQDEFGILLIGKYLNDPGETPRFWNPLTNSADCAAMCAKLMIDWINGIDSVIAVSSECDYEVQISRFINDREAAWRYAATMVAGKIGGMQ